MIKLGITIIGFNNVKGISRLLSSLERVKFDGEEVLLIFSIDYSGENTVEKIAREFKWNHGAKEVLAYEKNLGLKTHILKCGDYLEKYSLDAMAVLEDDICVSPELYHYMKKTVDHYRNDSRIAGISLYKHEYNIFAKHPFSEFDDGGDVFYMQYAMSWGQIWMRNQWNDFKEWYDNASWENIDQNLVPSNVLKWNKSWLKYHIMYCIDKDKYFVYPRKSISTNFTDPGTHNRETNTAMQVPLNYNHPGEWEFLSMRETRAVYDAFWENVCLKSFLNIEDIVIDLYGSKNIDKDAKYVLTRQILPYSIEKKWGMELRPIEANIFCNISGSDIFLYNTNVKVKDRGKKNQRTKIMEYDLKGIDIVNFSAILFGTKELFRYLKIKLRK